MPSFGAASPASEQPGEVFVALVRRRLQRLYATMNEGKEPDLGD
jgi:hypothetical protein